MPHSRDKRIVFVQFWLVVLGLVLLLGGRAWLAGSWEEVETLQRVLEDRAQRLSGLSGELRHQADLGRSLLEQINFLQDMPQLLPEQARFLKTQNILREEVEALRRKVGKRLAGSLHILVDTKASRMYLKKGLRVLREAECSVGKGGVLADRRSGRRWDFSTPKGVFRVTWKAPDPVWIKPDWAFLEAGQAVPPPDDPSRVVQGELGIYVLDIGNGYLIHGTRDEASLGRPVSHGCVRLGAEDLASVYKAVPVGARVYVY